MINSFKKYTGFVLPVSAVGILCFTVIANSAVSSQGIRNGLSVCAEIIIPSLFPFMVISSFTVKSGIYIKIGKLTGKLSEIFFNLPKYSSGAIIMGLIGGYPMGARMSAELFESGVLSENDAKRLTLFSINAGPAFVITGVGEAIYHSSYTGIILFGSVTLSSLTFGILLGIISRFKGTGKENFKQFKPHEKPIDAFINSASDSAKALFYVCTWVTVFCTVISLLRLIPLPDQIMSLLTGIIEVTNGCSVCAGAFPISVTAAFISFSGICIFCQLFSALRAVGIGARLFFASRLVCAIMSFIYCNLLTEIFPQAVPVFSNTVNTGFKSISISVPTTVCLIITCAILIFEVDRKKKIC